VDGKESHAFERSVIIIEILPVAELANRRDSARPTALLRPRGGGERVEMLPDRRLQPHEHGCRP